MKLSENRPLHGEVEIRKTFLAPRHGPAGYSEALKAVRYLRARWGSPPQVGIILGSGLGEAARHFQAENRIRYDSIPHFPRPSVAGHGGTLHLGRWGKASVAVLEGRMHLYEGYSPAEVAFPVRVLALSGAETLIFTCAAGGIAPQAAPGTFMLFSDHLNFQGVSPLAGPHDERWGARFVELGRAYDALLQRRARKACSDLGLDFFQGVYAAVLGPNYETPSEIRALRRAGADAVGMSTVPEVLAARQSGVRVLAVAVITNRAAGLSPRPLSHEGVLKVGRLAARDLGRFLEALLRDWSR